MSTEMTTHSLANERADLVISWFPSYWNKPLIKDYKQFLIELFLTLPAIHTMAVTGPHATLGTSSDYLPPKPHVLQAVRDAATNLTRQSQESQQASKFPKAVEG